MRQIADPTYGGKVRDITPSDLARSTELDKPTFIRKQQAANDSFGNDLSREYSFDIQQVLKGLAEVGVKADADNTIKQIAQQNEMAPSDVYALVRKVAENQAD